MFVDYFPVRFVITDAIVCDFIGAIDREKERETRARERERERVSERKG